MDISYEEMVKQYKIDFQVEEKEAKRICNYTQYVKLCILHKKANDLKTCKIKNDYRKEYDIVMQEFQIYIPMLLQML